MTTKPWPKTLPGKYWVTLFAYNVRHDVKASKLRLYNYSTATTRAWARGVWR